MKPACTAFLPAYAVVAYVALRMSLAKWSPIGDCDEVYNYWEPVHFLHHGTGMQTWEYAPQYALRTYAYLWPVVWLGKLYECLLGVLPSLWVSCLTRLVVLLDTSLSLIDPSPIYYEETLVVWGLLRATLAGVGAYGEVRLCRSLNDTCGRSVARWTLLLMGTLAGHFHAVPALLPSSTCMILWTYSTSYLLQVKPQPRFRTSIAVGLVATLATGWPFCALLFCGTGLYSLHQTYDMHQKQWRPVAHLLLWVMCCAAFIQALVMAVDYHAYGRMVSPTWNIFAYNAQGGGDELYGVEPTSYYSKNLLLNANGVAVLGLGVVPFALAWYRPSYASTILVTVALPMYLWLAIVVPRPHKEERFLFPIYPMLCVTAAISLDLLGGTVSNILSNYTTPRLPKWVVSTILHGSFVAPMCLISISRSLALSHHYTAPLQLYTHLQYHHHQTRAEASTTVPSTGLVCTAGEWHRFPSSYFLPRGYQLGFLKSSFTGQLPQPFVTNHDEQQEQGPFNDVNREELDRYVSIAECTYLVELVTSNHNEEGLQQMEQDASGVWTHIASYPFLDAEQTPLVSRILYIPTFLQKNPLVHAGSFPSLVGPPVYHDYTLYARTPMP